MPPRLATSAAAIALLLAAGFLATPAAQSGSTDLGSFTWPDEDNRSRGDLVALGQHLHGNETSPVVVGERPVTSVTLERVDDTTTDVRFEEEGGSGQTLRVDHEPVGEEKYRHTTVKVAPTDLPATVEVRPDDRPNTTGVRERDVLRMAGPPGSLQLPGDTIREKTEHFAARLGFPTDTVNPDVGDVGRFPSLFLGERTCPEDVAVNCSETAVFRIDCDSCQLAWFNGPEGDSDLDSRGSGLVLFDEEKRPVAATVSYALDLHEPALLDLEDAVASAEGGLRQRGHRVQESPSTDTVTVEVDLDRHQIEIQQVGYLWSFLVGEENQTVRDEAIVRQDAVDGTVRSVELIPEDVGEPPMEEERTPGFGLAGTLASLAAALAVRRPRGPG